jgi:predicted solute-binding protein
MPSEPAYVRTFKEYTKSAPTIDDIGQMEEEFYGQNDRACGILFGGWIDLALVSAIKSTFAARFNEYS